MRSIQGRFNGSSESQSICRTQVPVGITGSLVGCACRVAGPDMQECEGVLWVAETAVDRRTQAEAFSTRG